MWKGNLTKTRVTVLNPAPGTSCSIALTRGQRYIICASVEKERGRAVSGGPKRQTAGQGYGQTLPSGYRGCDFASSIIGGAEVILSHRLRESLDAEPPRA